VTVPVEQVAVEVFYASESSQRLVKLVVPKGSTVMDAVIASEICETFPELNNQPLDLGIYAEPCMQDRVLEAHDRVEIYRPLIIDPREARRQRALAEK